MTSLYAFVLSILASAGVVSPEVADAVAWEPAPAVEQAPPPCSPEEPEPDWSPVDHNGRRQISNGF